MTRVEEDQVLTREMFRDAAHIVERQVENEDAAGGTLQGSADGGVCVLPLPDPEHVHLETHADRASEHLAFAQRRFAPSTGRWRVRSVSPV